MLSILSLVKKYAWFSFGYQPSSIRIFSFLEVCKILANLKPFFPLNVEQLSLFDSDNILNNDKIPHEIQESMETFFVFL